MSNEIKEQLSDYLKDFKIESPLQLYGEDAIPARTAELFVCKSDLYPGSKLVLKLAKPNHDETIREEAKIIRSLHRTQVPYVIEFIAAGPIPQKGNRFGLVERFAKGKPLGIPKTAVAYEMITHTKIEALRQYLEFLTLAYGKANYAKPDHQVEATFWDLEGKQIQVVDFTPSVTAKESEPRFEIARRTVPQLVEFFADVFGCSTLQEPGRAIYAVDPEEVMPLPVLDFYSDLCELCPLDGKLNHVQILLERFSSIQQALTKQDFRRVELTRIDLRMQAIRDGLLSAGKST